MNNAHSSTATTKEALIINGYPCCFTKFYYFFNGFNWSITTWNNWNSS